MEEYIAVLTGLAQAVQRRAMDHVSQDFGRMFRSTGEPTLMSVRRWWGLGEAGNLREGEDDYSVKLARQKPREDGNDSLRNDYECRADRQRNEEHRDSIRCVGSLDQAFDDGKIKTM